MISRRIASGLWGAVAGLALVSSAWGYGVYGIDGYKKPGAFFNPTTPHVNRLGKGPTYLWDWAYEGGTPDKPLLSNHPDWDAYAGQWWHRYDDLARYSSDGNILTHTALGSDGNTGLYHLWNNHYFLPKGTSSSGSGASGDGFTLETRLRLYDVSGGTEGLYIGLNTDEASPGSFYLRPDNTVKAGVDGLIASVADISQWHTYRLAVLGEDPDDPGWVKANLYQDSTPILTEFTVGEVGTTSSSDYMRMVDWGGNLLDYTLEVDYFRIDTYGAWGVPEPGTLGMLGMGLLAFMRRRRR